MFYVLEGTLTLLLGWEDYMRALAAASANGDTMTPAEVGEIASRFDFTPA